MMKTLNKWLCSVLGMVAVGVVLSSCAQKMFYYPDAVDYGNTPTRYQQPFQDIYFQSGDGTRLHGWFVPSRLHATPKQAKGTVVHFHGNAQNVSSHYALVHWLPENGYNVFTFDYRGFGTSAGKVGFAGIVADADAALNHVRAMPEVDATRLFVLAQSIGGNKAIAAIGRGNREGIRAMVVDSTFYGYDAIANDKLAGASVVVNDQLSAHRYIAAISPIPLLMLHGTADEVIPYAHGERLFAKAGQPKRFVTVPEGRHIAALNEPYYQQQVLQWFERYGGGL
ncbi:alpha/beta hydrolase [Vitreoscilla massiliensis]|uniref:Alpha/beta hydrolase n=1 Tax=Vitreoscilla massiliensis TaxID=1689272 RepID=A0ABY4DXF2_9NEIS|nr:alpha/beta hydrolase [Vitreoscilla massiliensis]UOO88208.1 alpha/beta hydrolase [Vitreoscilla massiliensis]